MPLEVFAYLQADIPDPQLSRILYWIITHPDEGDDSAADQLLPHLHGEFPEEARAEGPRVVWQRSTLLMLAMTLQAMTIALLIMGRQR